MKRSEKIEYMISAMAAAVDFSSNLEAFASILYGYGIDVDEENIIDMNPKIKTVEYTVGKKERWKKILFFNNENRFMYSKTEDHYGNTYYNDASHNLSFEDEITIEVLQKIHGKGKVIKINKIETNEDIKENEEGENNDKEA